MPSLSSFCAVEKPLNPFSTMKAVIPAFEDEGPAAASVLAYTTSTSASGPLVIHILAPFRMNLPFLYSARVFIETTSDPEPASDMASAPIHSPEMSLGRYFFFCDSPPFLAIWLTQRLECAP